jgi:hypothetical protein
MNVESLPLMLLFVALFIGFAVYTRSYARLVEAELRKGPKNTYEYTVNGVTYVYEPSEPVSLGDGYSMVVYVKPEDPNIVVLGDQSKYPGRSDDISVGIVGMIVSAGFALAFALRVFTPASPSILSIFKYGTLFSSVIVVAAVFIFEITPGLRSKNGKSLSQTGWVASVLLIYGVLLAVPAAFVWLFYEEAQRQNARINLATK